jgi:hypothetical protein
LGVASSLLGGQVRAEEDDDLPPEQTSTTAVTRPQPPPWKPFNLFSLLHRDAVIAEIEARHQAAESFPDLLERVTRGFVAAPYLLSPLGEDAMPDPDPRFRMDAFDCTTFVETAIAMALCDDLDHIAEALDEIRYDGPPDYLNRRHLMTTQWIPGLVRDGYVEDITERIGKKKTKWIDLKMTKRRWRERRVARSIDLGERLPRGRFRLPYVTIADLRKISRRVPAGTIINIVREDHPKYPDVITHQGLIINKRGMGKVPIVRHASPVSKRVIDEPLDHMLMRYTRPRKWKIIGVNVLRVVDPREQKNDELAEGR